MIDYRVVNKSKSKTALLIHGLYGTSGYWLPYLSCLREHKLILLDIDYRSIDETMLYVKRVIDIVDSEARGHVDVIIAHSLGSLIASKLSSDKFNSLFYICPVFCANRKNLDQFVFELESRTRFSVTNLEIRKMLRYVDSITASLSVDNLTLNRSKIYLPDSDQFFSYDNHFLSKIYSGNHFDISCAMAEISKDIYL